MGGVGGGAEGGGGGEGLLGWTLWLLHLLWAQVDFDGPLCALQVYLQVLLEEEKPGHGSGLWAAGHRLTGRGGVYGWTPMAPTIHATSPTPERGADTHPSDLWWASICSFCLSGPQVPFF